jgi:hypothetical protein
MKKLTAKEILDIIKERGFTISQFAWNGLSFLSTLTEEEKKQLPQDKLLLYEKELSKSYKERNREEFYSVINELEELTLKIVGIGKWDEVEQHGGEDQGSNWYSVKYFKDHDVYIKTTGYYQSHMGIEFYEGYGEEVKPVEKTIVIYE